MSYEVPEDLPLQRDLGRSFVVHAYAGNGGAEFPIIIEVPLVRAKTHGDDSSLFYVDVLVPELVDAMAQTLLRRSFSVKVESTRRAEQQQVATHELIPDPEQGG